MTSPLLLAPAVMLGNKYQAYIKKSPYPEPIVVPPSVYVSSYNGRIGDVISQSGDYNFGQISGTLDWSRISNRPTTVAGYGITDAAPLSSPAFTGVPTAPIAADTDNSAAIATTAFVHSLFSSAVAGVTSFNGRGGAVLPVANDYTFAQIGSTPTTTVGYGITDALVKTNNLSDIASPATARFNLGAAAIASPTFTGTPAAPTPVTTDNSTLLATTAYVQSVVNGITRVNTFNGRSGAVIPLANDYTFSQLASPPTTIAGYGITDALKTTNNLSDVANAATARANLAAAPLASPVFTGDPQAPTPLPGDNDVSIATTAFVHSAIAAGTVVTFNGRNGAVVPAANDYTFAQIGTKPTTIAGYGITDTLTNTFNGRSGTVVPTTGDYTFAQIGSKPTTIAGYGITDTLTNTFNGRSGTVLPAANDYTFGQLAAKPTTIAGYGITDAAPIASPTFTGTPAAPTAAPGTNTTQLATTAFVAAAVSAGTAGVASFNGRTGTVVPLANDYSFAQLSGKPTTIAGYGITDTLTNTFNGRSGAVVPATNDYSFAQISGTLNLSTQVSGSLAWGSISGHPTTIAGYGITDTLTNTFNGRSGAVVPAANDYAFAQLSGIPTTVAGYGITDAVKKTGDTMTGGLNINANAAHLVFIGTAVAGADGAIIFTDSAGHQRWGLQGYNYSAETGGNVGSDFLLYNYSDTGANIGQALAIRRSDGRMTISGALNVGDPAGTRANLGAAPLASPVFTGNPTGPTPATADNSVSLATTAYVQSNVTNLNTSINGKVAKTGDTMTGDLQIAETTANLNLNCNGSASGNAANVYFYHNMQARWEIRGVLLPESGSNVSSDLSFLSYSDAGALLGIPLTLQRATRQVCLGKSAAASSQLGSPFPTFQTIQMVDDGSTYMGGITSWAPTTGKTNYAHSCQNNTPTIIGSITFTDSATSYGTTSDVRLKQDIKSFLLGRSIIDQISIKDFEWIETKERSIGVVAQDVYEAYPLAIVKGRGEPGEEGFMPWEVDYSKYVPLLIEALQDAHKRIDVLTNRIIALEAA